MKPTSLDDCARLDGFAQRLDARAKFVACAAVIVICVSTPRGAPGEWAALAGYALVPAAVLLLSRLPVRFILGRLLLLLPFAAATAVFMPFMEAGPGEEYLWRWGPLHVSPGGLTAWGDATGKAVVAAACLVLLSATTPFGKLLRGLRGLGAPRLFVMTAESAHRFLFTSWEEARRLRRAASARGWTGRRLRETADVGRIIGALFLRSCERGERVYAAMLARGWDGEPRFGISARFQPADALFVAAAVGWCLWLRLGLL